MSNEEINELIDKKIDSDDLQALIEHFKKLADALGNGTLVKIRKSRESCNEMLKRIGELEDALKQ
jgi:hypothetical protein